MLFGELQKLKTLVEENREIFFQYPQNWKEQRDVVQRQFELIHKSKLMTMDDYRLSPDMLSFIEHVHYINPSLAIKLGVNYVLFGGALYYLGTSNHHETLQSFLRGEITGCFAMTEIANGSNVKGLGTTIHQRGNRLVINTPNDESVKVWIGGGTVATHTVVFGQLYDEKNCHHGIHAVLVDLKSSGVDIKDMGAKMGLNGVDNVMIRFNQVDVSIDNLLNRYGGFENGTYTSKISNPDVRFGKMLSALSIGRFSIAIGSYAILYKCFVIAFNYNIQRYQFDKRIIEYPTQFEKFSIIYETLSKFKSGFLKMIEMFRKDQQSGNTDISKHVHALSSLLKVYMSWKSIEYTNWCREMCGGHGYLWANQIGMLMNDVNIYQTFEGDNTVLLQQGIKWILSDNTYKSKKKYMLMYVLGRNKKDLMNEWNRNLVLIKDIAMEYTEWYLKQSIGDKMKPFVTVYKEHASGDKKLVHPGLSECIMENIPLSHYPKKYVSNI